MNHHEIYPITSMHELTYHKNASCYMRRETYIKKYAPQMLKLITSGVKD